MPKANLITCTCKPAEDVDRNFCFQVISPQTYALFSFSCYSQVALGAVGVRECLISCGYGALGS